MPAILAFFQSLPALVKLASEVLATAKTYMEARLNAQREEYLSHGRQLESQILEIRNDEVRAEMARRLAEHRTRLP